MNKSYKVEINKSKSFELIESEINKLDIIKISEKEFHLVYNNQSLTIELIKSDFQTRNYILKINGKKFDSKIYNELDFLIEKMGFELGSEKDVNTIFAPMPGLIIGIEVEVGQEVKENDPILILEAMKMENVLLAPKDAVIKSIKVNHGETVDKNQLLVELE